MESFEDGLTIPLLTGGPVRNMSLSDTTRRLSEVFSEMQVPTCLTWAAFLNLRACCVLWQAEQEQARKHKEDAADSTEQSSFVPRSPGQWTARVCQVLKSFSVGVAHYGAWTPQVRDKHHAAIAEWQANRECLSGLVVFRVLC